MKTPFSKALREVRPLIAADKYTYICNALEEVGAPEFKQRIENLLGEVRSYNAWLYTHHHKTALQMKWRDFREARLQWIDHMIEVEESK